MLLGAALFSDRKRTALRGIIEQEKGKGAPDETSRLCGSAACSQPVRELFSSIRHCAPSQFGIFQAPPIAGIRFGRCLFPYDFFTGDQLDFLPSHQVFDGGKHGLAGFRPF